MFSQCRQIPGCWNSVSEHVVGPKGPATSAATRSPARTGALAVQGERPDPVPTGARRPVCQHSSGETPQRSGKRRLQLADGHHGPHGHLLGQGITWEAALNSKLSLMPKDFDFKANPNSLPNPEGFYTPSPSPASRRCCDRWRRSPPHDVTFVRPGVPRGHRGRFVSGQQSGRSPATPYGPGALRKAYGVIGNPLRQQGRKSHPFTEYGATLVATRDADRAARTGTSPPTATTRNTRAQKKRREHPPGTRAARNRQKSLHRNAVQVRLCDTPLMTEVGAADWVV